MLNHAPVPNVICPLGHNLITLIESVRTDILAAAYQKRYRVAVESLFTGHKAVTFYRCDDCGLRFFYPAVTGSPEFYAQLSLFPWYYASDKEEYRLAARRIDAGKTVLEVGCGTGKFTRYLSGQNYTGLEYNIDAVKAATEAGLDVRSQSVEALAALHPNSFDVVCSFQVLEHVSTPASFIEASVTCCRPGGLVIFGVPNSGAFLGASPDDILSLPPHHLTWWDDKVFWRVAHQFGLEVVAIEAEPLSDFNVEAYATTKALRIMMRKLNIPKQFLFHGIRYTVLRSIAKALRVPMMVGMYDAHLGPSGNSLLAVFRKI